MLLKPSLFTVAPEQLPLPQVGCTKVLLAPERNRPPLVWLFALGSAPTVSSSPKRKHHVVSNWNNFVGELWSNFLRTSTWNHNLLVVRKRRSCSYGHKEKHHRNGREAERTHMANKNGVKVSGEQQNRNTHLPSREHTRVWKANAGQRLLSPEEEKNLCPVASFCIGGLNFRMEKYFLSILYF